MTSLWQRIKGPSGGIPQQQTPDGSPTTPKVQKSWSIKKSPTDPNAPDRRLQLHQRCLYERQLPGNAFISAHVTRLQHGFYESNALHEDTLNHVYFVSVHFVFHPYDNRSHRFKSAIIRVSIHGDFDPEEEPKHGFYVPRSQPRILKHAPELIYGAVSPENLQWNFSLSSSLGVSQAPLAATLNPSGGLKASYKIYDMMSIQGSLRTLQSPLGSEFDIEDGMAVWSLQENNLQRSGLPREFDFVMLIHKPDDVQNVFMSVDVDPSVETWYGHYPQWYMNLPTYRPLQHFLLDFNRDVGQKFLPENPGKGFNFADLPHPLDEYVALPGTTYPTNDSVKLDDSANRRPNTSQGTAQNKSAQRRPSSANPPAQPSPSNATNPTTPSRNRRASSHLPSSTSPTPTRNPNPNPNPTSPTPQRSQNPTANRHSWAPDTMNVHVTLEHRYPSHSPSSQPNRYSYSGSPLAAEQDALRRRSIRRSKSRGALKEYGMRQEALQEVARESLREG